MYIDTESESEVVQSCLTATPWTVAYQAPPFMGFSRQGYWSGVPFHRRGAISSNDAQEFP